MPLYTHTLSSPSCPHYSPEHAISARAKGHICNAGDCTGGKTQVIGSNTFRRDTVMDVEHFWRAIKHFRGLRKSAGADLTAAALLSDLERGKKSSAESKRFSSKSGLFGFLLQDFPVHRDEMLIKASQCVSFTGSESTSAVISR